MDTERPDNEAAGAADEDQPRRRRSPVAVASVAASVLLVGGGGAYFAATASGGSGGKDSSGTPRGDGTPPLLALDGYPKRDASGTAGTGGIAPGEPDPNGVTYRAEGELPDGPSSAAVYRSKGKVTAAEVAELAQALGVEGTPKADGDAWKVGATKDGFGAGLRVSRQAPGIWTFSRFAPGTDNCKGTTTCSNRSAGGSGTGSSAGSESARGADVDPVSVAAAKKAAAPVLKAVGQDDAKLDAGQLMDSVRVVNAEPKVGGLPTYGWTTGVHIGPDGEVVGGSGQLKAPAKTDTYPVISAERTLGLLNGSGTGDGRVGIGGCASPVPLKDKNETPCEASNGASSTAPKSDPVLVEDAVFGLAAHYVDGRQALVPSWLFEVRPSGTDDSFTVTHPAVDPKYLTAPRPTDAGPSGSPTSPPSPRTSEPGGGTRTAPTTRDVRVEGYSADGKELTVRFTGGVCSDYSASADESGGTVEVRVTDKPDPNKVCIMIAKVFHEKIDLDKPLGDREVVGSDGKAVPPEKDLPDPTGG
ncbi:hypothetical protein OHS59_31980 [Streptomyces sp. NBC_00414]|uniref:hypothetical protein n=1 Tax=Streptomyces sp. NBC_00414 TaxID=2975739 RepID=UPI002E1CD183